MPQVIDVIRRIRQTEKGTRVEKLRQYVLDVAPDANKVQIKEAAEALFKVSVTKVNTQSMLGKKRRLTGRWGKRPDWKKAIITVASGQKIELK